VKKALKICIGITGRKDWLGTNAMLVDTFARLGHAATLVRDGDPAALDADFLLLTFSPRAYRDFPILLTRCGNSRPVTALWFWEPLPPPSLEGRAEQLGLRLARCDVARLSPLQERLYRMIPGHQAIRRRIRSQRAERLRRESVAQGLHDYDGMTPREIQDVMCDYAWFKEQHSPRWCDYLFASTLPRYEFLGNRGFSAVFVPVGYHVDWGRDLGLERDIDVLFLGRADNGSRQRLLARVEGELSGRGIKLVRVESGCFGEERTCLLNRSRIVFDIPRLPWEMPLMRLLMSMSCGAVVVSSWTGDPAPFTAANLVQAGEEKLAETIAWYLDHEDERRRIADAGAEFVTERLTLEQSVGTILRAIGNHAGIELAL
jgi:hypothetical protein